MLRRFPRLTLTLLVVALSAPFLGQPFHIDDRLYLEVADHILQHPFSPYDYPVVFEGLVTSDMASHSRLPLIPYYLAFIKLLTGSEREWIYHLAFLIFPIMAALAFYDLASRSVRFPVAASFLLVASPAVVVLSHTLMTDVALLSFWLVAFSRLVTICRGQARKSDWIICASGLLAAAFISLITAGLILLMLAYVLFQRAESEDSGSEVPMVPILCLLALPVLLWSGWFLQAYFQYDRLVLVNTVRHMVKRETFAGGLMGQKLLSFLLNAGGTFVFPLALWYAFAGKLSVRIFILIFYACFIPFYIWFTDWSWTQAALFALFFSTGLLVLWQALRNAGDLALWCCKTLFGKWFSRIVLTGFRDLAISWGEFRPEIPGTMKVEENCSGGSMSRREQLGKSPVPDRPLDYALVLWFFGILLAYLFLIYSGSARYSMLALPPVLLWWFRSLENRIKEPYFLRNLVGLGLVTSVLYALPIAYADYRFAALYPTVAAEITGRYQEPGRNIWFTGEWGFRYYFEKAGGKLLTRTAAEAKPGDIIVKPFVASPWVTLYDGDEYIDLLEQHYAPRNYPVRILDFASHAGFYSTGWGILPLSWNSTENWEWFNVFRVKKEYTGPIPEPESHF